MTGWKDWLVTLLGTTIVGYIAHRKQRSVKMSEKEIVGVDVGPETKVGLKLKDGAVVVEILYSGADGFGSVAAGIKPEAFLDKLKAAIPGTFDDIAIDALKAAIK